MSRNKNCSLRCALLLAGALGLGYAGLRRLLGWQAGAEEGFFERIEPGETGIDVGPARVNLPIPYYRDDCFMGIFSASYPAVRALLPSADLHPVVLPNGRAIVAVIAFNYLETGVGSYGEIGIALPCTYGRLALPLLPLALESRYPGWGGFVLHLPVTTLLARQAGRLIWGYPKFIADMAFTKLPAYQSVRMEEGGGHILSLTVRQKGLTLRDNRPLVTYTARGDDLLRTSVPTRAVYQLGFGASAGKLELGSHWISDQLRQLEISSAPLVTKNYLSRSSLLPVGEVIAHLDHPYIGYLGKELEKGRLAVAYSESQTIL